MAVTALTFVFLLIAAPLYSQTSRELQGRPSDSRGTTANVAAVPRAANAPSRSPEQAYRRWYIAGTLSLLALQAVLITTLLLQSTRRRRAEETARASETALRTSSERIRQLTRRVITAQEAARTRIARDLHDDVCQELAGLSIAVSALKRSRRAMQDPFTQEALSSLQRRSLGLAQQVRRLSHDLHPGTLRHLGLGGALESHCAEIEQGYDVQVTFKAEGDLRRLNDETALCLFRIAQEAMRNAVTHGKARRLTVFASSSQAGVELAVADDGGGFDLAAVRKDGSGFGLVSMEERARLVGGSVHLVTRQGSGTTVRVAVPTYAFADTKRKTCENEPGGRDERAQSLNRRRSQAVCRGHRTASQRPVRGCRNRRGRQHARRSSAPPAPGRSSA